MNTTNFSVHTYYYKYGLFLFRVEKFINKKTSTPVSKAIQKSPISKFQPKRMYKMVKTYFENNTLTVFLSGEIDHNCAGPIRNQIDGQAQSLHPKTMLLDFSKVSFMDSSGIGLIMGRYRTMSLLGGNLKVINIPERLQRIINLSGVGALGVLK